MADGAEFQRHERVRVREDGRAPSSLPDTRFLGKHGTIQSMQYGTATPPTFYFVEFDSGEVESVSADWLEPAG